MKKLEDYSLGLRRLMLTYNMTRLSLNMVVLKSLKSS